MCNCFEIKEDIIFKIEQKLRDLESDENKQMLTYMGCSGCVEGERRCGIILTKKCQLACKYCYEKGKNSSSMEFNTARSIVERELEKNSCVKKVHIDLFGGEPFLAFDVMKALVEYLKSDDFSKEFYITTITNGVAIHGEIQEWLKLNRKVIECPLSLDGTREMQERNRPNSFDRIDLDFFARELPGTRAKMTVAPNTIDGLAKGTIFIHSLNLRPQNGLAYGVRWPAESENILIEELKKLIEFYLENYDLEESLMLKIPYKDICMRQRSCDAGKSMVMYDVDGTRWPCHMFLPMSIGEEKAEKVKKINFKEETQDIFADEDCKECSINKSCVVCRGMNFNERSTLLGKDSDICILTKIIYKAKAYLAAEKWIRGLYRNFDRDDERMLLKSIVLCSKLQ